MANRKVRPGNRIAQMLLSGEPVSLTSIRAMFAADPMLAKTEYKISGYVGDIRKYDQGVVKVVKDGRTVLTYQLLNAREFDANGHRLTGEALTAVLAAQDATQPIAETVNPYTSVDVDHEEVVTSEPETTAEVVTETAPSADVTEAAETVTSDEPVTDEVVSEDVGEPLLPAVPAKPKRNRFSKKAA